MLPVSALERLESSRSGADNSETFVSTATTPSSSSSSRRCALAPPRRCAKILTRRLCKTKTRRIAQAKSSANTGENVCLSEVSTDNFLYLTSKHNARHYTRRQFALRIRVFNALERIARQRHCIEHLAVSCQLRIKSLRCLLQRREIHSETAVLILISDLTRTLSCGTPRTTIVRANSCSPGARDHMRVSCGGGAVPSLVGYLLIALSAARCAHFAASRSLPNTSRGCLSNVTRTAMREATGSSPITSLINLSHVNLATLCPMTRPGMSSCGCFDSMG